jgi:hypothetical protein
MCLGFGFLVGLFLLVLIWLEECQIVEIGFGDLKFSVEEIGG